MLHYAGKRCNAETIRQHEDVQENKASINNILPATCVALLKPFPVGEVSSIVLQHHTLTTCHADAAGAGACHTTRANSTSMPASRNLDSHKHAHTIESA